MVKYFATWATLAFLLALVSTAQAQQLRADVGLTSERQGISINVDVRYYIPKYKMFALGRLFIEEPDGDALRLPTRDRNPISLEMVVGRSFRAGSMLIAPLAGIDSNKRVLAGADISTKVYRHTVAYLGYGKIASDSAHVNGMRHRLIFDLKKDEKIFLRFDWRTEGPRQEHCRLGVEFNTRIDKLNLPVYAEPFWNFTDKQLGLRLGMRL
jgi:hypothetical protein